MDWYVYNTGKHKEVDVDIGIFYSFRLDSICFRGGIDFSASNSVKDIDVGLYDIGVNASLNSFASRDSSALLPQHDAIN